MREFGRRGVEAAEVFVNTFREWEPSYGRELRRIADDGGVEIVSLHPFSCAFEPFLLFTGYERRFEDALEFHKPYFELMNLLGAKIFVFHGDKWRGDSAHYLTTDAEYCERFARLRDLGRSFGVTVAQENVQRCRSRDPEFLRGMVRMLDGDVAFVFDNKQAVRAGVDYRDYIEAVGDRVVHLHLSDNGPSGDCLPLGQGTLDVKDLLARLRQKGFAGAALVELYGECLESREDVFRSLEYLKQLKQEE